VWREAKQSMLFKKLMKLDCFVTLFLAMAWILSATLRSRQAYFVPRKDTDHDGSFNLEMD